jgi:CheY-like chemotaxis protein/signal transduction histidine kinase/CHASE3 domain sensor protein
MNDSQARAAGSSAVPRFPMPPRTLAGFLVAMLTVAVIAALSYVSLRSTDERAQSLTMTVEVMAQLQTVLSTLKDAETGERGYLLTGREDYLDPYTAAKAAIGPQFVALHQWIDANPVQRARLVSLQALAGDKMADLAQTVALRRSGQADQAMAVVLTNRGKDTMDRIRAQVADMEATERELLEARTAEWHAAATRSFVVSVGGSTVLLLLISAAAALALRDHRTRQRESWVRTGQMGLSAELQGDPPLEQLGNKILGYLSHYLHAQVGAIYLAEGGHYRRFGGFALPGGTEGEVIRPGEGLTGQAAKSNQPQHVRDLPADYLSISSALGRSRPAELVITPASINGVVYAVLELGFAGPVVAEQHELLSRAQEPIAIAIRAAKDRSRLEELLEETRQQTQELQTREEELRVNNEELEEQGRSLRESRSQLESQQAELEQINAQLEEQTADLQRANDYKSEFLANMSHELRTPLNSTLILAKLLADNKDGNLSAQQVKFAQTISSAGNDLLALINDVLDLSRIEAGKIELSAQAVAVAGTLESLDKLFRPAAEQKKLRYSSLVEPGAPAELETDPQRLGQILKNLISNALKFTERGEVQVRVFTTAPGWISFAVRDTGVGIAANQQGVIFEAFRQADGSIHRKYGGTGLGLSISRDLARLLGGTITVDSMPGRGSVFTLSLPVRYSVAADAAPPDVAVAEAYVPLPQPVRLRSAHAGGAAGHPLPTVAVVEDDRESLSPGARLILVIEDDVAFATILRDLAREMGFQCVVSLSANDGLAAAAQFRPSAMLLDINLPDHSGLGVLDQLKRDSQTRHIPVHVVSGADYRREALELGAVGYAFKPTRREELVEAVKLLEDKLSQALRRVLIVEDDPRQRESIRHLLENGDVDITAVASAGEALFELKTTTFDCMVMDFNLPDLSGYDLLEKMARQEDVAFPPVIVYTGRALSAEEEQRLRRYSNSIIIKDARSPERLLDEVTLFLHQVEARLPPERQQMLKTARNRDSSLEGRRVLIVEDDVRNIFALSSVLEPKGAKVDIARNGLEALEALARSQHPPPCGIDMVLMDIMMPEMDGLTAMREIRKRDEWKKIPIIALTAKAMKDDQEKCLAAGANDYIAKPLDVEKLLSLVRVWMPR